MDSLMGIGFRPLDEEIIDLLKKKRLDPGFSVPTIKEIDFYGFDPWELTGLSEIQSMEDVWYFFSKPKYKCAKRKRSGQQQHRKTKSGTWKKTGSGSEMKQKNSTKVIGKKDYLVFIHDGVASEKANTEWLMHEIAAANDPLYKENFVVCRLARKNWDKKLGVSTTDEHQSSPDCASCSSINVIEGIFLESAEPPDRHLASKTNHVVENIFSKTQLPPSENLFSCNEDSTTTSLHSGLSPHDFLIPYSGNHVAENTFLESVIPATQQFVSKRNHVSENNILVSQAPPSDHLTRKHVVESTVLVFEVQARDHRNHVVENTDLVSEDQLRDHRNHVAENTVESSAKTQQLAEFNPQGGGNNGLNDTSFPAPQPPVYPEQESSCSNGSSYGSGLLNSQFDGEQVDGQFNSQRDFQNECSPDETGQITPDFFSSKSDEGVFLEDESDANTETESFNEWVKIVFDY